MPSASRFILKDSHPAIQELITAAGTDKNNLTESPIVITPKSNVGYLFSNNNSRRQDIAINSSCLRGDVDIDDNQTVVLQGHSYNTEKSLQPGGITLHDMTIGLKYACMSIVDDKPDTLRNVGKANPWQIQGIKEDVLEEEIYQPLTYLMEKYYSISVDHELDTSGWKGGHVLDNQGYIGHNDSTIVLAYRCTTSVKDWLTNLTTTTSIWESEDIVRGHSGAFSGIGDHFKSLIGTGICTPTAPPSMYVNPLSPPLPPTINTLPDENRKKNLLRVHTGFYNNFISSVPAIERYIDPLLTDTSKPKTLYIVGHSLGGGIAHMALCYFLLEHSTGKYNWSQLPHRVVLVTAGSPRAYTREMQERINFELTKLKGIASAIRLVRNKDAVASVPPASLGFQHCNKFVYITKDDAILINPNLKHVIPKKSYRGLLQRHPSISSGIIITDQRESSVDDSSDEEKETARSILRTSLPNTGEQRQDDEQHHDQQEEADGIDATTSYDKKIQMVPVPLRDHMPEFYLKPLIFMMQKERQLGSIATGVNQKVDDVVVSYDVNDGEETINMVWNRCLNKKELQCSSAVGSSSVSGYSKNKLSPKRNMTKSFAGLTWLKKY
jgi:Lipase (class 3)